MTQGEVLALLNRYNQDSDNWRCCDALCTAVDWVEAKTGREFLGDSYESIRKAVELLVPDLF